MAKRNLTIQLDEDVVRRARVVAAKRGTSVSGLVSRQLQQLASEDERYEAARRRAIELMRQASEHGGRNWTRDDLYGDRQQRHDRGP